MDNYLASATCSKNKIKIRIVAKKIKNKNKNWKHEELWTSDSKTYKGSINGAKLEISSEEDGKK